MYAHRNGTLNVELYALDCDVRGVLLQVGMSKTQSPRKACYGSSC